MKIELRNENDICNCQGYDLDITQWVFSPKKGGGWFCMKCCTNMGWWRDGIGEEDWRQEVSIVSDVNPIPKPTKKNIFQKLGGLLK